MKMIIRWTRRVLLAGLAAVVVLASCVYALSERQLRRRYEVSPLTVTVRTDSTAVARGEHLARAVTNCTLCHGEDGGGAVYMDAGLVGRLVGPNLTRGRRGGSLRDEDWVRALRHGVRANGTSLMVMPSEVFVHLNQDDLGALIAYYRSLPPVDRVLPRAGFGPLGRALLAAGKLNILVAPKTPTIGMPEVVPAAATAEYGRYLSQVAGCQGCHGYGLSGGRVAGPPDLPPASNLTPAALSTWAQADFVRVMREGKRPNGTAINDFMPWRSFAQMTDEELEALWLYLQSVPAKPFGNK